SFATQSVLAIQNARQFQEIDKKGRELEIASKHKSQFLANMSHELRTPLNAILGYTELILDNIYGEAPPKIRETLERIDKNGHHLLKLINDVLDLSKIEAGSLKLNLADYAMDEVARSAITATEPVVREKSLTLNVAIPSHLSKARGDERRLTQVLLNLLSNAVKFTEAGEIRLEVTESDGRFCVSVGDTGIGIDESDKFKIFEEFYQADDSESGKKTGTGLGLPISKRIIEMHGGRIWVDSKPGQGSVFTFTLPIFVDSQVDAP
ncbi:MAG TPA: HAMP domain-containing sensor histidine kinase, partial [Candidatus Binatia bacterium]|nr:HAMP domain-containing sensor histidine kinase [Candidatus Binatia bacterium]